jgi:hypothetical protein
LASTHPFELFHAIGDASSAKVRRFVVDHSLGEVVRFRNVSYPEVVVDLSARGGSVESLPALWNGAELVAGADAIIAVLMAWKDVGRG